MHKKKNNRQTYGSARTWAAHMQLKRTQSVHVHI